MATSSRRSPKTLSPEAIALADILISRSEQDIQDEIDAILNLSPEQVHAELTAAGMDLPAIHQRFRENFAQRASAPHSSWIQSLAKGIDLVREDIHTFLSLNRTGLETLRRSYLPATLDCAGDRTLEAGLEQADIAVVVVNLVAAGANLKLGLRWRRDKPATAPTVAVTVRGEPQDEGYEWPDWCAAPDTTPVLTLLRCSVEKDQLQKPDAVLLHYHWDAERNHLVLDLLPPQSDPHG